MILRNALVLFAALFLASCQNAKMITSIQGGESKVFEPPPYEVRGKTQYDQNWIDSQVEGGVAAFGWARPKPRPPEFDAPAKSAKAVAQPKKKASVYSRVKARVKKALRPTRAEAVPFYPPPAPPVPAVQPPPAPPRDAVDELLYPSK